MGATIPSHSSLLVVCDAMWMAVEMNESLPMFTLRTGLLQAHLLFIAPLMTRLAKQFAMLLLRHPLAALLDN